MSTVQHQLRNAAEPQFRLDSSRRLVDVFVGVGRLGIVGVYISAGHELRSLQQK